MSAKHKHEAAEDEEDEEGFKTDDSGDEEEDGDKVAAVLTKVHVDCLDPIGMMLPYPLYDSDLGVEFATEISGGEDRWVPVGKSKKIKLPNRKGVEYTAMRFGLSLVASPLPPNTAGSKVEVPLRGPSRVEVLGGGLLLNEVTENLCAIVLPMPYINQSVDGHYTFKGFHTLRKAWETVGEGVVKLVTGDANNNQAFMVQMIFDTIYP